MALLTLALALTLSKGPATIDLFKDKGGVFIKAGSKQGLKVGDEVVVLDGKTEVGSATVMEVFAAKSRVSLDEGAKAHPAAKKVRLGAPTAAKGEVAVAAPAAPAPADASGSLKGHATIFGFGPAKQITLYNESDGKWTNCDLRLPTNQHFPLAELRNDDQERIFLHRFKQDGVELDRPLDTLQVKCDQGSTRFQFQQ
jgi:hypothetical protein